MSSVRARRPSAFTLIELLIVMAIIALLIALLLPAVQAIRETASKTTCTNNLKQIGIGLINYNTSHASFPYSHVDANTPGYKARHSWAALILAELDQEAVFRAYNMGFDWNSATNKDVVNKQLKVFQCPAADPDRFDQIPNSVMT